MAWRPGAINMKGGIWVCDAGRFWPAFVIGALAGMLIRRVVPAIVTTLAVYAGSPSRPAGSCASTT